MTGSGKIDFIIDEQNIATGAEYELCGYLNQQLTFRNPICDLFSVEYVDSKNEKLVQLADFLANSFYRNIEKHNQESKENIKMWKSVMCNQDIFDFSDAHDISLHL
jgi:hypothetical protein